MSEGKVEQSELYARSESFFAQDGWDGAEPLVVAVAFAEELLAEAYARGVRDAAKRVALIGASCPYASSSAKRLPIVAAFWHGVEQVKGTAADVILALLQANPYRAVVETEAKK